MNRVAPGVTPAVRTMGLRIIASGDVQGVGFRPFVYHLACELGLRGWVANAAEGVVIEIEGEPAILQTLLARLPRERPRPVATLELKTCPVAPVGYAGFEIRPSLTAGARLASLQPDLATCPACLAELFDPADRRYRYPFISCTLCGPRYTIVESLPYDRANTTMRRFPLCEVCQGEYADPTDRRFHHQANACPACGPGVELWDRRGDCIAAADEALQSAAAAVRRGDIVAVKGLGGFHLFTDAANEEAIQCIRRMKARKGKPFALMFPSLEAVASVCEVSPEAARLLCAPEAPIVLLPRRPSHQTLFPVAAPETPYLGVMLPYTPLHHLLLVEAGIPLVATSGNRGGEPLCTEEREALGRLADMADLFLVHDRPIARPVDDSVVQVVLRRELVLRRARGYAPRPVQWPEPLPPLLATGGHLKNTVALSLGQAVLLSPHIGDLETAEACAAMEKTVSGLLGLHEVEPEALVCDRHPDYHSSRFVGRWEGPCITVQHHHAHAASCMAENELQPPVLAVVWDGAGLGPDGALWGGEFLRIEANGYERMAHLRYFPLPGGEQAMREPRRAALGLLYELYGNAVFAMEALPTLAACAQTERRVLRRMLERGINAPRTSSMGRLFDVVSSLLGLRQVSDFEGQAAMSVEFAVEEGGSHQGYPFHLVERSAPHILDWGPLIEAMLADIHAGESTTTVAARFHATLVEAILAVAARHGNERMVLTGGCFQNAYLLECAVKRLRAKGFAPYWHRQIPPNDGGLALGQIAVAARFMEARAAGR